MQEIAADLDQDSKNLSEPSVETVTEGSKNIGETQQQLDTIDNDSLDGYKKEWHELRKQYEQVVRKITDELSSLTEGKNATDNHF